MASAYGKSGKFHKFSSRVYLGLLVLAGLVGCASGPKTYEIKGEADPMINKDISGKPLSVVVRLYQLKDAEEFSRLTFDTLASGRPESELLGQDLLEKNEVILVPGAKYVGKEKLKDDAKYVGVVALFRQPDPHYWRYLVEADKVRAGGLSFKVQDCYLLLANLKPSPIPGQPANATPFCTNPNYRLAIPAPQSGQPLKRGGAPAKSATQIEQWIFNRP